MCSCCPYGYHIDLDFVRYCESVSQEADRTGSIKRRKDRRRQRQSMEVLLGITPPVIAVLEQSYKVHAHVKIRINSKIKQMYI
jgi:isopropylmalate/homocitrate/citramalate synthase